MTESIFKYKLEAYKGPRSRHTCPQCSKKGEFTRYIDNSGQYIADYVGKCNRQEKCGYHYPPAQYFTDHPQAQGEQWQQNDLWQTTYTPPPPPKEVTYIALEAMQKSIRHVVSTNLYRYLVSLFGEVEAKYLASLYHLGASREFRNAGGLATAFWQVDELGHIRQCKVMAYDPATGKRLKDDQEAERLKKTGDYRPTAPGEAKTTFFGKRLAGKDAELKQCFFGAHIISQYPTLPICLVESEKTAIIMAGFKKDCIWIATGGKYGARWTERDVYTCLTGRHVILYPDLGAFAEWQDRAKLLATVAQSVTVSNLLERSATDDDRARGLDLADFATRPASDATPPPHIAQDERAATEATNTPPPSQAAPHSPGLPQGFKVIKIDGCTTFEIDDLPMTWLSDDELKSAITRMKGYEREVMTALHPDEMAVLNRYGFEIEAIQSF